MGGTHKMSTIRKAATLLLALLVLGILAPAVNATGDSVIQLGEVYVNPLYADVITEEDLSSCTPPLLSAGEDAEYVTSADEAGCVLREQLKARQATATVYIQTSSLDDAYINSLVHEISSIAMEHTGDPVEGDYIYWQFGGWSIDSIPYETSNGVYYLTVPFSVTYYTTAAQEAEMDAAVENLLAQLNLYNEPDYIKVKGIYDYICQNITYDYNSTGALKHTAYAALINRTAVCQGYAALFYRLALELDVDNRLIAGTGNGGAHGWNIVKLNNVYYNLDSTWDAGLSTYSYFLKCPQNFVDHTRYEEYDTAAFHAQYPISAQDHCIHSYSSSITSAPTCTAKGTRTYTCGKCGDSYQKTIAALGHTKVTISGQAATCTIAGSTDGVKCTTCGEVLTAQEEIPATGHDWVVTSSVEATCQSVQSATYVCTYCGSTKTETEDVTWSSWSTAYPADTGAVIQEKTQYRYRDYNGSWTTAESGTIDYVASWPSGFHTGNNYYTQYNNTPKTASETSTQRVLVNSNDLIGYVYYHWCRGYTNGPINRRISDICDGDYVYFHAFFSTSGAGGYDASGAYGEGALYYYNTDCCKDSYWYHQIPVYRQSYTIQQRESTTEGWTNWSEWSDTAYTATESRQVETRTLYRYATGGLGDHKWSSGTVIKESTETATGLRSYTCILCGETKTEVIPKKLTEVPFTDVPGSSYYTDAVLWAVNNEITAGYGDSTTFAPDLDCTRGQIVTFLWRAAGKPDPISSNNPFMDVKKSDFYYKAVLWAVEQGITDGYGSSTTFAPNLGCTRGQVATFLHRYFGTPAPTSGNNPFKDVKSHLFYYDAVLWAVEEGITTGYGDSTTFAPDTTCNRAQIVTFLYRALA